MSKDYMRFGSLNLEQLILETALEFAMVLCALVGYT